MERQGNDRPALDAHEIARRIDEVETRIEAGDTHGALRAAEELAAAAPRDPDVLSSLARAQLAAGDSESAADAAAQLLSLSPEYAEALRLLEECRLVSPQESELGAVTVRGVELDDPPPLAPEPALAPAAPAPPPQATVDPATVALRQRVDDLLGQARMTASHGRHEESLALLSRLLILDDQNEEALAFEEELRTKAGAEARHLDDWLNEGVQCLEQGRFEDARQLFLRVLERSPGHSEALDFLEKADAQLALREEEGARAPGRPMARRVPASAPASPPAPAEVTHTHVWTPTAPVPEAAAADAAAAPPPVGELFSPEFELESPAETPDDAVAAPATPAAAPSRRRTRMLAAAAGVLVVVGGFAAWKLLFSGSSPAPDEAPIAMPKAARGKPATASVPKGPKSGAAQPAVMAPAERSQRLSQALARAAAAYDGANYEGAVLAYNDALALDPENATARQGLLDAGEGYKAHKAQLAVFDKVRRACEAGEYESALRMVYRLPAGTADPSTVVRYKVSGWYNLGVIALRAADCTAAQGHFKEALALQPADPSLQSARELADRCSSQRKDRTFYDSAEALKFRSCEK